MKHIVIPNNDRHRSTPTINIKCLRTSFNIFLKMMNYIPTVYDNTKNPVYTNFNIHRKHINPKKNLYAISY
jgi:hypothetical protein